MSLTLASAETLVRLRTRHPDVNDPRATSAQIRADLNRIYKQLRLRLQDDVPQLYVLTAGPYTLEDGDENTVELDTTDCGPVTGIFRIDRSVDSVYWRPIDRASELDPNDSPNGKVSYYRKGNCLVFGPDLSSGGQYRIHYYVSPVELTDPTSTFALPDAMDDVLVLLAAGWLLFTDGDGAAAKQECDALAETLYQQGIKTLKKQYGRHPKRAGLRMVV